MKFNLLKYILPPDDKVFYHLFADGADTCCDIAKLYLEIAQNGINEDYVARAKDLKHKSNDIVKETLHKLNKTFVTPIDREDIQNIATLLNKIAKKIVKACVNLRVYRLTEYTQNMKNQAKTLNEATDELKVVLHKFKKESTIASITKSNLKMKEIETKGDEILYGAMDELFSDKYDALSVIKLRDIYKDIENALDTCFSVSDTIVNVVLKQS